MKIFWILFTVSIFFASCKNENEEEYFILSKHDSTSCDTLYVTYAKQIKPMFERYCVDCHKDDVVSGCNLDNYEHTVQYVRHTGTKLYDYVKNNNHAGVILDNCSLKQLKKWVINPAP